MRIINALCALLLSAHLFAGANAPIQRIDVVNMLGLGASQTPVTLSFETDDSVPCFTTILPIQGAITLWAGPGLACKTVVTTMTIVPFGETYTLPIGATAINGTLYSAQIVISQNTSPVFDPSSGSLKASGTIKTTVLSH